MDVVPVVTVGTRVQSLVGVGSRLGYPYFGWGLYECRRNKSGNLVWAKIGRRGRFRSDQTGRLMYPGVPVVSGVRHRKLVGVIREV